MKGLDLILKLRRDIEHSRCFDSLPGIYVCPHFKRMDPATLDLLFTKASLTRFSDPKMFYYTHSPIEVYAGIPIRRTKWEKGEVSSKVTEEQVLNELVKPNASRRTVIVIEGNTGTGKSELCAYLALELEKRGRLVLQIEKNADLLDVMTRIIPDFYKQNTGRNLPYVSNLGKWKDRLLNNLEIEAKVASGALILELYEQGVIAKRTQEERNDAQGEIEKILLGRLNTLSRKGEDPADLDLLTAEDLKHYVGRMITKVNLSENEEARELNKRLWQIIRGEYQIPRLDEMLDHLTKDLGSKRPVIIFEDFTIAGLDLDQIVKYLETDKSTNLCDFVLAGTQDKMHALHTATGEERFKYYSTSVEGSKVLFLNEETAFEFIEPFISYGKTLDGSISKEGNAIRQGTTCDRCRKCPGQDIRVFPFNRNVSKVIPGSLSIASITDAFEISSNGFPIIVRSTKYASTNSPIS